MASTTFEAALTGRSVIVRTSSDPHAFDATSANLEALAALGLPVPHVLRAGVTGPFAYLILPKIPGRDLRFELPGMSPAQQTAVAERVVAAQAGAATLPSPGAYGYAPVGGPAPLGTWRAVLDGILTRNLPAGGRLREPAKRVSKAFDARAAYLSAVPPTCFLDDLTTKNVIVERGELRGFVDFDHVCFGDRLLQIGLTETAIVADLGIEDPFYVAELCRLSGLDAAERRVVDLYAALFAVEFLARGAPADRAGQDRLATLIDRGAR